MSSKPGWRELDPFIRVQDVRWQGGKLVITGCAYVAGVNIRKLRHTSKVVILRPVHGRGLPRVIPARSYRHLEANIWSGQKHFEYDWAGFRCEISPRRFRRRGRWLTGEWDALVLVRARAAWRAIRLTAPACDAPASGTRSAGGQVAPGFRLAARWTDGQLAVQLAASPAELRDCRPDGGDLAVEVDLDPAAAGPAAAGTAPELAVAGPDDAAPVPLATTSAPPPGGSAGGLRLTATVRAAVLRDGATAAGGSGVVTERRLWIVSPDGRRSPVAFAAGLRERRFPDGAGEILVERTGYGDVTFVRREQRPVLDGHSWSGGALILRGAYSGPPEHVWEMVLARQDSTDTHTVPLVRDGDRFAVTVDVTGMLSFGRRQPLRDGDWQFSVRPAGQPGEDLVPLNYDRAQAGQAQDQTHQAGPKIFTFTVSERGVPLLHSAAALGLVERGRVQRRLLHDLYFPVQRR